MFTGKMNTPGVSRGGAEMLPGMGWDVSTTAGIWVWVSMGMAMAIEWNGGERITKRVEGIIGGMRGRNGYVVCTLDVYLEWHWH